MATTKNIQSVARAFSIVELFLDTSKPERSLKEISEMTNLPKTTAFGLVNTLYNLGYLNQNPDNNKYRLSLKFFHINRALPIQQLINNVVHPVLEDLNQKVGETVHFAGKSRNQLVYLDKVEQVGSASVGTNIGGLNYLHCTGVGKCLLAYSKPEEQEMVLRGTLEKLTKFTITDPQELRKELEKIRERGYSLDMEEISVGLRCVAVPVFASKTEVPYSISMAGFSLRIEEAYRTGVLADLKQASKELSKKLFDFDVAE